VEQSASAALEAPYCSCMLALQGQLALQGTAGLGTSRRHTAFAGNIVMQSLPTVAGQGCCAAIPPMTVDPTRQGTAG